MSNIDWTDKTWNPVIGCSRVTEGCRNCYAERLAVRLANMGRKEYDGLTNGDLRRPRWTGEVRFLPGRLGEPKTWTKPCLVFVNSMSDLLHEALTAEQIGQVVDAMAETPRHTYQVLTKRPERLAALHDAGIRWPDNVWLGVSVEDQASANRGVSKLIDRRYARVSWVSYEPAIGPVDWSPWASDLDWIVVGGESGPGARSFDPGWARDAISTFGKAGTPVFVKQLGTKWAGGGRKGNKPEDWPVDLRVREYPRGRGWPTAAPNKPKQSEGKARRSMRVCIHEAAHAMAAFLNGAALDYLTVDHDSDRPPHVQVRHMADADAHSLGVIYAAGSAAAARFSRRSTALELLEGGADDLKALRNELPDPDDQLKAIAAADIQVSEVWVPIRALARELRSRGTMTMDEVSAWVHEQAGEAES